MATNAERERVKSVLTTLGFHVVRSSPVSVIVEAEPEKYQSVFAAKPKNVRAKGWRWSHEPQIPEPLKEDVDTVALPQLAELHTA